MTTVSIFCFLSSRSNDYLTAVGVLVISSAQHHVLSANALSSHFTFPATLTASSTRRGVERKTDSRAPSFPRSSSSPTIPTHDHTSTRGAKARASTDQSIASHLARTTPSACSWPGILRPARHQSTLSHPKKPNPSTQKPNRRCLLALCPSYFSAPGGRGRLRFPYGNISPPPRLPPSTSVALLLVVWKKTIRASATITTSTPT